MSKNEERQQEQAEAEKEQRPVAIHNRDIPLLTSILSIMQDVRQIERQRDWQNERRFNISQHLTGMPGGGGLPKGLDEALALLAEIDEEQGNQCKLYVRQLKSAQKILNGIPSRNMRTFVLMKYVMNVPDVDIRKELNMTRRGFDRARRCVEEAPNMAAVKWQERYIIYQETQE